MKHMLGELLDNAADREATDVRFTFGPPSGRGAKYLVVEDDGDGCDDLTLFLKYGGHLANKRGGLGRWGCGFKDASLWGGGIASTVEISSVHKGKERRLKIKWADIVHTNDWGFDAELLEGPLPAEPGRRGTRIVISPIIRKVPEGQAFGDLLDELAYMYTPAINKGLRVTVRKGVKNAEAQPLAPWKLPELNAGFVDREVDVDGRQAWVRVGVVPDGVLNSKPGITYFYRYRVIESASSNGCGDYGRGRIAGWVRLGEGWALNKNKDGFKDADALYDAVFDVCKDMLSKAAASAQLLESAAFLHRVAEDINEIIGFGGPDPDSKGKRGKGTKSGTQRPTGDGSKHTQAENQQPGRTFVGRGKRGALTLETNELPESAGIGLYDGKRSIVLASNNAAIAAMLKNSDSAGIKAVALSLVGLHVALNVDEKGQRQLDLEGPPEQRFATFMAKAMGDLTSNGAKVFQFASPEMKAAGGER